MKTIVALLITTLISTSVFAATVSVDASKSSVKWTGTKVTGKHMGTIGVKSGKLEIDKGMLKGGMITIDMKTIKITDISGEYADKLLAHLNSNDFFAVDVKGNETSTFKSSKVKALGKNKFKVDGSLTIKKKSEPASFVLTKKGGMYVGELKFDRTKYNIRYGSGSFFSNLGDKVIHDEVVLKIALTPKK
jgi:polyisoprenoid-binding protein YceI